MKKKLLNMLACLFFVWPIVRSEVHSEIPQSHLLASKLHEASPKKNRKATVAFAFNNEELIDIINMLAAKKGINIILPTGANAITSKVTMNIPHKLTLQEAWDLLYTLLDIAGYSLVQKHDLYLVVKNSKTITSEPFPIYINTPATDLPNTDERIRYMYYLKNIKASQEFDNQINGLFKELMPEDTVLKADSSSNGLLIIGKAQDVKSFIHIVEALDEVGFQENLEIIRLRYTQATNVAKIFSEILKTTVPHPTTRYNVDSKKEQAASYFSSNMRVIAEPRTNSLIVLGKIQAVERIKDFIFKHIDVELDSGKSVLHIYELQYLDAADFAPVLRNIVDSARSGGTEQSKAGGSTQSGTERFFDQVIIQPDNSADASEESAEGKYFGGNKLVVAARNDDWKRIKVLIEELDQPQPQVIIEVLLADLTLDDARSLGAITRNPTDISFPGTGSIQAAMIDQVVLDAADNNQEGIDKLTGVASDLNAITVPPSTGSTDYISVPQDQAPGSTVISISDKDGRTWSILEVLQLFNPTKILSHPHIIAINNQKATIEVGETRLVTDQAAPSTSGITIRKKELTANTNVYITPRISVANTVNLLVEIKVDQFNDPTNYASGNRISRYVITNATVKSGDILALGGLIREDTTDTMTRTPILSDIPILGWFFKRKNKTILQTSLTIFISPTIIQPKLRGGVGEYTKAYVDIAKNYSRQSGLFDNLRDPITRWFFKADSEAALIASDFLEKDQSIDALHKSHAIDLIAERESELLDKYVGIAPIDTTTPLKEFLVKEENPLKNKPVKSIEGAPRIKENAAIKDKNTPLKSSSVNTENKNNVNNRSAVVQNNVQPKVNATKTIYNNNEVTSDMETDNNNNLKNLLEAQENPLINKSPISSP